MAAKLYRPRVTVSQVTTAQPPTVLTPSLLPCMVGPCFQIVEPLTPAGEKNSDALVLLAAQVRADAVGDLISLSGKKLKIAVGGGSGQVIGFPITVNSMPISQALVVNSINSQLSGAYARFLNNQLVIRTLAKGASARLKLMTIDDDGYTDLGLSSFVERDISGMSAYDGLAASISYKDMPSPKASVDEITFDSQDVSVYRFFNNTLLSLSQESAVNWNSYTGGASKVSNVDVTRACQPALSNTRTPLFGKRSSTSKTNLVVNPGVHASVTIPFVHYKNHGADITDGSTAAWPDCTGQNYLRVTAVGLQNWLASSNGTVGNYIGAAGNDITVVVSAEDATAVSWSGDVLTVNIGPDCTFAELADALSSPVGLDTAQHVLLEFAYDPALADSTCYQTDCEPFFATHYLSNGVDPVNFGTTPGVETQIATVTGAVQHADDTVTGGALDIVGESLLLSIGGSSWREVTFSSDVSVVTAINAVIEPDALGSASVVTLNNPRGEEVSVLQIAATSPDCHDSTIQLKGSTRLIENLFGGFRQRTVTNAAMELLAAYDANAKRRGATMGPSVYNPSASTRGETTLVPGNLSLTLRSLLIPSFILSEVTADALAGLASNAAALPLVFSYNGAETTITAAIGAFDANPTLAEVVIVLNARIAATALNNKLYASAVNGKLCIYDVAATPATFKIVSAGSSELLTALFAGLLDTETSSAVASILVKDDGESNALRILSVSNGLRNGVFSADTFDFSSPSVLTTYLLDSTSKVVYSADATSTDPGVITIVLRGDDTAGHGATAKTALFARFPATPRVDVTFVRDWYSALNPNQLSYSGRVFHGDSHPVYVGDMVKNGTNVLGRVVAVQDFKIGSSVFTGAQLALSEYSVANAGYLYDWYIVAHGLDAEANDRLQPEMTVNTTTQSFELKHVLNRSSAGLALAGNAPLYVGYKALRLDVTAAAGVPQLLLFNNTDEVAALIGPISPENPLAYALYCGFLNAPSIQLAALGVADVSADAPNGTLEAYEQALGFLGRKEVYSLATCSQDRVIADLVGAHVTTFSGADQGKERIGLCNLKLPTEKEPKLAISGNMTIESVGGGKYELTFTDDTLNVVTALDGKADANGNTISASVGQDYGPEVGLFLDRGGDAFRWLITKIVSATTVQIDTTNLYLPGQGPGTGGNGDAYFQTDSSHLSSFEVDGELCSVNIRQAAIDKSRAAGRLALCETLAEIAGGPGGYQNQRLFLVLPERVIMPVNGTKASVPGYYISAALAAMCGQLPPQQSFSNYPLVGFMGVEGSSDIFSEDEMATAASGGILWVVQDTEGAPLLVRHQLSTDTSSVVAQEMSIRRSVDVYAKAIRNQIRGRVGRNNITKTFLQALGLGLNGVSSAFVGENRPLAEAAVTSIGRNPNRLDGIVAACKVTPWFPVNAIDVVITT
jgi:hypothetical protein